MVIIHCTLVVFRILIFFRSGNLGEEEKWGSISKKFKSEIPDRFYWDETGSWLFLKTRFWQFIYRFESKEPLNNRLGWLTNGCFEKRKDKVKECVMPLPSIPITPFCLFSSATSNFWMISAMYSGVTLVIYAQKRRNTLKKLMILHFYVVANTKNSNAWWASSLGDCKALWVKCVLKQKTAPAATKQFQ